MNKVKDIIIANATIGFKNFEGREGPYNDAGKMDFAVFLDEETADALLKEGWNVKYPKEYEGVDPDAPSRDPHLSVAVSFDNYPAKVIMKAGENLTPLNEEEISMLDWAELEEVDLVIRPYSWEMNGNSGIKAYLKAGYFTIVTDAFSDKYGI